MGRASRSKQKVERPEKLRSATKPAPDTRPEARFEYAARRVREARELLEKVEPQAVAVGRELGMSWFELGQALGRRPEPLRRRYGGGQR